MSRLGMTEAFAKYGAALKNAQWSVSAWAPDGSIVVSLWNHHWRKSPPGTMEFSGSFDRWSGHGNAEFRENVARAFAAKSKVKLVIVKTDQIARVEAGDDASALRKEFFVRDDVVGEVSSLAGPNYVFRFTRI